MGDTKSWISAFRLRTLPLAFSGWLVGTTLAYTSIEINWYVAGLTLLTAFLLQILSNLANDYGDAVSGVDSEKRKGPNRMVQSGKITKKAMGKAILLFSFLSFSFGSLLLSLSFKDDFISVFVFLILGLLAIGAAIKYTVGINPYGYAGFGDLYVFLFFGMILVFGTYYLQVQSFDWAVLLPAASIGLLSVGVLNVNNIRDIESDKTSGKNSIPVRIGRKKAVVYHTFLLQAGIATAIVFSFLEFASWWQFIFIPINLFFFKNIQSVAKKPLYELDPFLKQMAISTLLFSILFSLGVALSAISLT
ncbi:MAG: 1,4-dihydroxy-2-naphthoate polyprenyltransferase [Bacteroidota bacterium]